MLRDVTSRSISKPYVLSLEGQLWALVLALMGLGTLAVYSGSAVIAAKRFADPYHYLKRQLLIEAVGIITIIVVSRFPYRWYIPISRFILAISVVGLGLLLIPGVGVKCNNAQRWLRVGYFLVQPSEYSKVAWVLYLCAYCIRKGDRIRNFRSGFLPPFWVFGIIAWLLIEEPDFGTLALLFLLTMVILFAAGVRLRHLGLLVIPMVLGFYFFVYRVPYRWSRVEAFLNPWVDPLDSGYQLIQSWIAVGSGGLWGRGLGRGQQKLFFLPEPFTDFILAVIAEELGFIGLAVLILLFSLLFWKGIQVANTTLEPFGALLAYGLSSLLAFQCLMNMGVVVGLLPTKGMALPFISYGGSALTTSCIAVGILINIQRDRV